MTGPHTSVRHRTLVLATAALVLAACGGGGGGGDDAAPTTGAPATSTTTAAGGTGLPGAGEDPPGPATEGPFCDSIQGIQGLGAGEAAGAAPEQVLAQNEAMLDLLDEASANVPAGAPAAVEALFDDYRTIAVAIGTAGGDVEAAYTALQRDEPELAGRIFNDDAHLAAFAFFADHCGIRFE